MGNTEIRSMAICIQALEDAIRYYDLLAQSETTNNDGFEQCRYMYEVELSRLCALYATEEKQGNTSVALHKLLKSSC